MLKLSISAVLAFLLVPFSVPPMGEIVRTRQSVAQSVAVHQDKKKPLEKKRKEKRKTSPVLSRRTNKAAGVRRGDGTGRNSAKANKKSEQLTAQPKRK